MISLDGGGCIAGRVASSTAGAEQVLRTLLDQIKLLAPALSPQTLQAAANELVAARRSPAGGHLSVPPAERLPMTHQEGVLGRRC